MGKRGGHRYNKNQNKTTNKRNGWKKHSAAGRNDKYGTGNRYRNSDENNKFFAPKINLREDQVGITEYVSGGAGFTGILKSRFSDFHVNEIDMNGEVLQLNDLSIPHQVDDSLSDEDVAALKAELRGTITDDVWSKIDSFAEAKLNSKKDDNAIEIDINDLDKEKRTQLHKAMKQLYAGKLVSTTTTKEFPITADNTEPKQQRFLKICKAQGGRNIQRNNWTFPGDYVYFLMHKENMDTSEVAAGMATRLNLRPSQVNYCGTKDKRAKTTQRFCIKKRTPSQIINAIKYMNHVHIGNFEFRNEVLKLGQLLGNRFRLALRHVNGNVDDIEKSLKNLREHGFINYYGLQRFGNCADIPTYEVGIALLKSDYKLACELILKPRDNDVSFMRAIREAWWENRDSAEAAKMFRNNKYIEKKLLDGLAQYGEHDYATALRKLPRNMLLLYPHAFQSLVFNQIASRRIKEFGLKLIPGDLVYRNKEELDLDTLILEDELASDESQETTKTTEGANTATNMDVNVNTESIFKRKVKSLTEADIASGDYNIFDLVMPLPGFDVTYPGNAVGAWYEEVLQEYGLSSEKLRHNVKTYAMAGAYRKVMVQPTQMSWKFCDYDNAETTLISSDWDLLKGKSPPLVTMGKLKALILEFSLPTSAYATMLLRELLKTDTSAASQTKLEKEELKKVSEQPNVPVEQTETSAAVEQTATSAAGIEIASDTNGDTIKATRKRKMEDTPDEASKPKING